MLQFTISARLRLIEVLIFNVTNTKLFVNLIVWFQLELEEESVCQKNLEYIEKLQAKDKEEREKQLKMDQETAHGLQKEELEHLGDFSLFHRMHICFFFSFFTLFSYIYDYCDMNRWMYSELIIKTRPKFIIKHKIGLLSRFSAINKDTRMTSIVELFREAKS